MKQQPTIEKQMNALQNEDVKAKLAETKAQINELCKDDKYNIVKNLHVDRFVEQLKLAQEWQGKCMRNDDILIMVKDACISRHLAMSTGVCVNIVFANLRDESIRTEVYQINTLVDKFAKHGFTACETEEFETATKALLDSMCDTSGDDAYAFEQYVDKFMTLLNKQAELQSKLK